MTNKIIVAVIIAIVVILGSYSLLNGPIAPPQENNPEPIAEAPATNVVTYTDAGFSPNPLTIKVGKSVTFRNESSRSMWPASALHPTHREYPTTGGCLGSTFDACRESSRAIPGRFEFDIAGNWRYHDHLNPSSFGMIIVE